MKQRGTTPYWTCRAAAKLNWRWITDRKLRVPIGIGWWKLTGGIEFSHLLLGQIPTHRQQIRLKLLFIASAHNGSGAKLRSVG